MIRLAIARVANEGGRLHIAGLGLLDRRLRNQHRIFRVLRQLAPKRRLQQAILATILIPFRGSYWHAFTSAYV